MDWTPLDKKKVKVVGKWQLEKLLGVGGQAEVWEVRHAQEHHAVPGALKVLRKGGAKAKKRFVQEIDLLRSFSHPGIVRVVESGDSAWGPFFVMEKATTTLEDVARAKTAGTRLIAESRELVLRLLRDACAGVAHMHQKDVLHRDIKPSNILLMLEPRESLRAVVSDLGISSPVKSQGALTGQSEVVGSPSFRAPELVVSGATPTRLSDVYALGKTIECVFTRSYSSSLLGPGECPRDKSMSADMWNALDEILRKSCAVVPEERYADAAELLEALPVPVLVPSTGSMRPWEKQICADDVDEACCAVLASVIAECPTSSAAATVPGISRGLCLSKYQISMAINVLKSLSLIDIPDGEDFVVVTGEGIRWAHQHTQRLDDAQRKFSTDPDDIPF